ncbi:hypothetical protein PoB_002517400 [Plakobranchus ocellatus]|uniref:Uncharacterized protein n=1 Tax=Plakobranchus ocellatus TaxID=259542 RepID=A0AAV3ZTJ6_9GAST|nr:hypothetical protein PoB_002517400 [Plakobranchus ocellatus]
MKTNTACIEDLLCECPGMTLADLVQQFESSRLEYVRNCTGDSVQESAPGKPAEDVIVGEVESDREYTIARVFSFQQLTRKEFEIELFLLILHLTQSVAEMEQLCPGYTHCLNLSSSYNRRAKAGETEFDRRVLVCEGSRMNILCLEDVLCACGWSREQVARRTVRQLRHNHETYCDEDLTIGYLTCDVTSPSEQQGELCSDFVNTCERRVVSRYKALHNNTNNKYVSCDSMKRHLRRANSVITTHFCLFAVPTHRLRAGEVYCTDQIQPGPHQIGLDLGVEEGAKEISLLDMARRMDKDCPGYEKCFNVTSAYNLLAAQQKSLAGQLSVSCEGSRYAIICLEDALCACGWSNNTSFRALLRDLRHQHEAACSQDLTIGYLECRGELLVLSFCFSCMILTSQQE